MILTDRGRRHATWSHGDGRPSTGSLAAAGEGKGKTNTKLWLIYDDWKLGLLSAATSAANAAGAAAATFYR